jgi:hypothetical protein
MNIDPIETMLIDDSEHLNKYIQENHCDTHTLPLGLPLRLGFQWLLRPPTASYESIGPLVVLMNPDVVPKACVRTHPRGALGQLLFLCVPT